MRRFNFVSCLLRASAVSVPLIAVSAVPCVAAAQSAGIVIGRVTDANGAALPGAQVSIRELGLQTATNTQGEFTLSGVPAGTVTLEIGYIGLQPASEAIAVQAGRRSTVSVTLHSARDDTIDTVMVTAAAIREGTARALNQQRMADNITNVVSSDAIGRFPDPNIAEALQRVPGLAIQRDQGEGRYINVRGAPAEFTAVSLDGISLPAPDPTTRAIDLDTIPSDIVNALEISKTLRPDQDADSVAGAVNIVTRSPFDSGGFRLNTSAGVSYNDFGGTNDTRASFLVSDVLGDAQPLGLLLSASYSKTRRQVDNIESAWELVDLPEGGEAFGLVENLFKDYDTRRERLALTGMFELRPAPGHRAFLRSSYARFEDDEFRNRLGILWEDGTLQPGATDGSATFANTRIEKQFRHRIQRNEITSLAAGAEHQLALFNLDYTASFSRAEQTYPKRNELLFRSSLRPTLSYDYSADRDLPYISLFDSGEHLQIDRYAFRENTFRENDTTEDELAFATNLEIPAALAGNPVSYKMGLKYRGREKEAHEERFRDRRAGSAPAEPLDYFLSGRPSDNYHYLLGNKMDSSRVNAYLDAARATSERRIPQSITADYRVDEDIYAAYASARIDLGRADVLVGARMERTEVDGSAPLYNEDTGETTLERSSRSYTNWFPGVTLRYAFSEQLIGRTALTRAIARPNYPDIVPRVVEVSDGAILRVTSGNPDLEPLLADNFDAALEYYYEPMGIASAGVFYKDLQDYHFTLTLDGSYLGQPAQLTRPENAPDGRAYGFELNWQQQFTRLPGWASGFGVFANYTYTDAEMKLGRDYAGRSVFPLPGQSRDTYNIALFYEKYGFNARLSYTARSDYLDEINADDGRFDLYWEGRGQLDFTSSVRIGQRWETFLEAKNLTNSPGVRYFGSRNRVYEYEKFGYSLYVGARVSY